MLFRGVLNDQDGCLVGVVIAYSNDAKRPVSAERDRVACLPLRDGRAEGRRVGGCPVGVFGRKGGRGRRGLNTERVHPSLREHLRAQVPSEQIWQALRAALEGENQSAKVAASRVLMDALAEPREAEGRAAQMEQVAVDARARLEQLIQRRATRLNRAGKTEPAGEFHDAAAELWAEGEKDVRSSGVLVGDRLTNADARAVLEGLLDLGLLRRANADGNEEYEQLRQENAQLRARLEELDAVGP